MASDGAIMLVGAQTEHRGRTVGERGERIRRRCIGRPTIHEDKYPGTNTLTLIGVKKPLVFP